MLSLFPRDVLDEIWDLIEVVSKGFPTYSRTIADAKGKVWDLGKPVTELSLPLIHY